MKIFFEYVLLLSSGVLFTLVIDLKMTLKIKLLTTLTEV